MRVRYEENVKLNDNLVNMCYFTYSREILGDLWWSLIKIASIYLASSHLATNARCPDFLASIPEFLFISIGFCPKCNKLTLIETGSWKLKKSILLYLTELTQFYWKIILAGIWGIRFILTYVWLLYIICNVSKNCEMNNVAKLEK
jgi:hypothetical protein